MPIITAFFSDAFALMRQPCLDLDPGVFRASSKKTCIFANETQSV
jgi:hypothetical protein